MKLKSWIKFIDEKLSGCVDIGDSLDQGIKFFTDDGVIIFPKNELQRESFFDVNTDLDYPE